MIPAGPERTARFIDYFFAPDVDQAWIDELVEFDNQVGAEDRALVEAVQRGVRSGVLTEAESSRRASSSWRTSSAFAGKP
jgi:DNA-binding transcriptional regulator PaaX